MFFILGYIYICSTKARLTMPALRERDAAAAEVQLRCCTCTRVAAARSLSQITSKQIFMPRGMSCDETSWTQCRGLNAIQLLTINSNPCTIAYAAITPATYTIFDSGYLVPPSNSHVFGRAECYRLLPTHRRKRRHTQSKYKPLQPRQVLKLPHLWLCPISALLSPGRSSCASCVRPRTRSQTRTIYMLGHDCLTCVRECSELLRCRTRRGAHPAKTKLTRECLPDIIRLRTCE
ncbi:unnamed protein product [Trichogramma brassicae]|uniref:Uncharacterized protein n=1 Tax=Trichogramma brassicae TaxID=86971 RepID=A0A6H5IVW4_9HYME|nr:unnamed protein product [Trichogramma brassicae]